MTIKNKKDMKQRPCAIEIEILSGARVAIFPLPQISRHTRSAHTARGEVHKFASTQHIGRVLGHTTHGTITQQYNHTDIWAHAILGSGLTKKVY